MDADLCMSALRLNPELWLAVQIVDLARKRQNYPIESADQLAQAVLGRKTGSCRLDGAVLNHKHANEFFPKVFFPIADEDDLLKKVYAALCWGRSVHHAEHNLAVHRAAVAHQEVP